jgi:HSP20 family molecular chaperone IbpA
MDMFPEMRRLRREMNRLMKDFDNWDTTYSRPLHHHHDPFLVLAQPTPLFDVWGGSQLPLLEGGDTTISNTQSGTSSALSDVTRNLASFKLDIHENDREYVVSCDLPGVKKEDVKIDLSDDGLLTIKAERSNEKNFSTPRSSSVSSSSSTPSSSTTGGENKSSASSGDGDGDKDKDKNKDKDKDKDKDKSGDGDKGENKSLTTTDENKSMTDASKDKNVYRHIERSYGLVQRSIRLPRNIDRNGISAKQEHGVLTITIPKSANQSSSKSITIA